jgi:hydrogenase expression/formation protein HypC
MCLALPAKVVALHDDDQAVVDVGGITKEISVGLLEEIGVGDYVIVHVGYALARVDEAEAERTLALLAETGAQFAAEETP